MKIMLPDGTQVDINDNDKLALLCDERAEALVKAIPPNNHSKALRQVLGNLQYWFVKNGALLVGAHVSGSAGIGMESALESHNFIAELVGEQPLTLAPIEYEPGPNDVLEAEEEEEPVVSDTFVDAQGRPLAPGALVGAEGNEL